MAVPYELLLHPELLSNEQLIQIIQERHLRIENLQTKERYDLLDIFHQYCVPYGQRKPREARGKALNESRNLNTAYGKSDMVNNNCSSKKISYPNYDRLKPSNDALSGQMKRIKLECTAASFININKRKMSVDSVVCESPPIKKERKIITWP